MRFLVVDDSRAMRSYVRGALNDAFECEVVEASSGFDALRHLPRERFDFVITDVNMPDINGIELLRFVRSSAHHRTVPVIIITTQASERERERMKSIGANGFLAKPFEPSELVEIIESLSKDAARSTPDELDQDV